MVNMMRKVNKLSIKKGLQDSFSRDIVVLIVVSILIGSLLAGVTSLAANAYFSKTLANLVGDYGEYDILIQSREEMKEDTAVHVQKIMDEVFPGGRVKEGPTITGKTSFFIAMPEEYKTKKTYEELGKTFGGIPGGAGVGVLTEPRLTLRGVPEGAKNMLIDRISQMDGVGFAFRDGSSVGVVLKSLDKSVVVSEQIKKMIKQYQVIEISFPVGSEPQNPIRMGESIASAMQAQLKLAYVQNASIDGKNDDMTYLVSTMMELKRFLVAYTTQVQIVPSDNGKLIKGDMIAFSSEGAPLVVGDEINKNTVLVEITTLHSDGTAGGRITQNDVGAITNNQGYKVETNKVGAYIGNGTYKSPRQELSTALMETAKIVGKIPMVAQDARDLTTIGTNALDNYGLSMKAVEQTLASIEVAGNTIQTATSGLAKLDTGVLQNQVDHSSKAMGGLINTLQVFKLMNGDVGATIENLSSAQRNLGNLKAGLGAIDHVAENAQRAKGTIDTIVASGHNTINVLQAFDIEGARTNMTGIDSRLAQLSQLNIPLVMTQLEFMAAAAPNLKDEEISHSVNLLDKFIAGQVIPGERIQILTNSNVTTEAVAPIVYSQVGHNNVSLYSTELGVIEPNARGELYAVLNEVRAILAGMTAVVLTLVFLALDHTAIMTVIRRKRRQGKSSLLRTERWYGAIIGAVLLTAMFILAGGGIPYVPWMGIPVIGGVLGVLVACYTEKISPVVVEEVMAGQSLGLSMDEIMREIIIPNGRPGLLQKLNQRKVKFP